MTTTSISVSALADWATNRLLDARQPPIPRAERNLAFRISKFNNLVMGFNVSTGLLVAALASVFFFSSLHIAVGLAILGAAIRMGTGKELLEYSQPDDGDHVAAMRLAFNNWIGRRDERAGQRVCQKIGIAEIAGWNPDRLLVERVAILKNRIPADARA